MKSRKGSVLALTALAVTLCAGLSLAVARDDDSKLHKAMEKVNKHNGTITKNIRAAAAFKKNQKEVVDAAKGQAKIGKEFREEAVPTKDGKEDKKMWTELMDSFVKESESFAETAEKSDAKQADVKEAYKKVTAACSACHGKFKPEE